VQESLLSHIASNFISEYENVANSSITYLLNKYPTSREVLKNILQIDDVPSYFVTELATKSNGRPDVTGLDINGNKQIIIEGKFWANLTDNQPINYLKELPENGKLLFLVPEKRKISLNNEIKKRLNGDDEKIYIFSWNEFLNLVEVENNKNHNHTLISDIIQFKELCSKMDEKGIPPLSQSDLDPMNGRVVYQFASLINECKPILKEWEKTNFQGLTASSSVGWNGFYFRAFDFGCQIYFSSYKWFSTDTATPIWIDIFDKDFKTSQKIYHFLNNFDSKNSYNEDYTSYGIKLQTGMDKTQIVNHIVNKIKEVLTKLNKDIKD
jgi:hypothetical protein